MPEAFIVDAVRTPVGRRGGGLADAHPADLGAHVITALLARTHCGGPGYPWTRSTWLRSTRHSPRWCWPGSARPARTWPG